jgi:glycosyltransferase involved in cell wall biosynthesis
LQLNGINEDIMPLIHLIGYVQNSDLPFIYQLSTAFIYPSTRESFGIPILEAMACGVPVLTSNTASMPEVAGDAALFMNPFDIFDIAKNILEITENKETRAILIKKGLARVETFRWFKTAEKLMDVYQQV